MVRLPNRREARRVATVYAVATAFTLLIVLLAVLTGPIPSVVLFMPVLPFIGTLVFAALGLRRDHRDEGGT